MGLDFDSGIKKYYKSVLTSFSGLLSKHNRIRSEIYFTEKDVQENWHEDFVVHVASIIRPKLYVEIGVYQCAVFNRIIPYAEHLIGVDIWPDSGTYMDKTTKTEFIHSSSSDFEAGLAKRKAVQIDMLFIDADHSREAVLQDFNSIFPYISPGGMILLHDSYPRDEHQMRPEHCSTCYLAVEELSYKCQDYEMVTIPVHPGLTICRKRKSQLKWKDTV